MESVVNRRKAASWIQQYRSVLLLVGAVVVGGLAAIGTRHYIAEQVELERERLQPQQEEIDVVVAKRDLQRGEFVTPETMAVRRMPRAFASSAIVRPDRFEAYVGSRLSMPLSGGEPLIAQAIEGLDSGAFSTKVRTGIRAMTIAVDEVNSISGMLQPGDRIDLQLTARPVARGAMSITPVEVTKVLMQDLVVLATGRQVRQQAEDGVRARTFTAITVEVTPEQAQKLIVAQRGGRLTATLRNRDDRVVVEQKALDINDLLGVPVEARPRGGLPAPELIVGGQGPLRPMPIATSGPPAVPADALSSAQAVLRQLGSATDAMNAGLAGLPIGAPPVAAVPASRAPRGRSSTDEAAGAAALAGTAPSGTSAQ